MRRYHYRDDSYQPIFDKTIKRIEGGCVAVEDDDKKNGCEFVCGNFFNDVFAVLEKSCYEPRQKNKQ